MIKCDAREIGNRLLQYRKDLGMTQSEVAELSSISDRAYAEIERGNAKMRVETMVNICNALKISPNDILAIDNNHLDMELFYSNYMKSNSVDQRRIYKIVNAFFE